MWSSCKARDKVLLPLKLTPQLTKLGAPQAAPSTLHLIQSKELGLQQIPLKMGGLWGLIDVEITFKNNIINQYCFDTSLICSMVSKVC
jgi:hypothetical protein